MSLSLIREQQNGEQLSLEQSNVSIDILDHFGGEQSRIRESSDASITVMSTDALKCFKEYLPLPSNLDDMMQFGSLDISETFYVPTSGFYDKEI